MPSGDEALSSITLVTDMLALLSLPDQVLPAPSRASP
jgi:hypothetical protein